MERGEVIADVWLLDFPLGYFDTLTQRVLFPCFMFHKNNKAVRNKNNKVGVNNNFSDDNNILDYYYFII